jgi:glycosyltransferase involved in cell wall biosynthesis
MRDLNNDILWLFPNQSNFNDYSKFNFIPSSGTSLEDELLFYLKNNNKQPDVIFFHFVELFSKKIRLIKSFTKAKIIVTDHNPRPLRGYSLRKKIKKSINGFVYRNSIDIVVSVSEVSKYDFLKEFGFFHRNKSILIRNGIPIQSDLKRTNSKFTGRFIVACNLRKEKGIQDLLFALSKLKSDDFLIDIYGEGNYGGKLKEICFSLKLNNNVNFKGSTSKIIEKYIEYDYLVHPSHSETYCFTVVEALSVGLPVITTENNGNILGLIKNNSNGFLYKSQNINQLTNIFFNLFINKKQILIPDSDIKFVKNNFSTDKMVSEYLKIL